jgi:hypothetical protein
LDASSLGGYYEEYGLLDCNAIWFGDNPNFRMNISPPSSGLKNEQNRKAAEPKEGYLWALTLDKS